MIAMKPFMVVVFLLLGAGTADQEPGNPLDETTCGLKEETISTDCLGDSLVKSQAHATAKMVMGGSCTAWLVKAATSSKGALMLTTGHCAGRSSADFIFDYTNPCGSSGGASPSKRCRGERISVESGKDEQGIYELQKPCAHADAAIPILLDIGTPDRGEGMYMIGHPRGRPQELSHQEPHDNGHHCEVRQQFSMRGSKRIRYYCDTQGGNSGSPVFSARTGYAFAIHSHGGCGRSQDTANSGGLLGNSGVVEAFDNFGIPYVNRDTADLFKYEEFVEEASCDHHDMSFGLHEKSLAECKSLCVGSLTCVGIEYSASERSCLVNYRSKTSSRACRGGSKFFSRTMMLTKTLTMYIPSTKTTTSSTTTTTTSTTAPLTPASGFCGFEGSAHPYCGIWWQNTLDKHDWVQKSGVKARNGSYMTMSCTEVTIFIDMAYDGSSPGRAGSGVTIKANGMKQSFVFHPGYSGGAARTEPGFGNQNIGFTPASNVFHRFVLTLRKSRRHTFTIQNGENKQQEWSKDFDREGLFTDISGIAVEAWRSGGDGSDTIMVPGRVYTRDSAGKHSSKLLAAPSCKASETESDEYAKLEALTPVLTPGAFLSFFYHMSGDASGALKVRVRFPRKRIAVQDLWSKSGDQGDGWKHQTVSLEQFSGESVIVSLVGTPPGPGTDEGIAIDDVMLSTEPWTGTTTTSTTGSTNSSTMGLTTTQPKPTTTTTAGRFEVQIREVGGQGCLKSNGRGRLLEKSAASGCATFEVSGKQFKSVDEPGQCLDYFSGRGWGLWVCHGNHNQQLQKQGSKWCYSRYCVEAVSEATTTQAPTTSSLLSSTPKTSSTSSTTTPTITTITTTETSTTPTATPAPTGINSGDTVFLRTRAGSGNHIDVEEASVMARWQSQGSWQALVIEKENSGAVHSGDIIYLKSHTGSYIDIVDGVVQARWEDRGTWQSMTIEKSSGETGAILVHDTVCLKAHDGNRLDVEDEIVRARWQECGLWQQMVIEKEAVGTLFSGDSIHMLAHTGNRLDVGAEGASVQARWSEAGLWQTFTIQNYGGRVIHSGDAIFIKAHTEKLLHVQDTSVLAEWKEYGAWQTFILHRKSGAGPVMPGDSIFLQAHTGRFVEVEGVAVSASWFEKGAWQTLIVEKAMHRRLTNASHNNETLDMDHEQKVHTDIFMV